MIHRLLLVLFVMQLRADGLQIVVIAKRIVGLIKTVGAVSIEHFVCHIANGGIYRFKRGVIIVVKIVAGFVLNNVVISGDDFKRFVGKIVVTFRRKEVHYLYGRLVKAFVN